MSGAPVSEGSFLFILSIGLIIGMVLGAAVMFTWLVGDAPRRPRRRPQ